MTFNDSRKVVLISSYNALLDTHTMINRDLCKMHQKPNIGVKVNDLLEKNEDRFFKFPLGSEGNLLKIEDHSGKTKAFFSFSNENPSSALNDGEIEGSGETFIPESMSNSNFFVGVSGEEVLNNYSIESHLKNDSSFASID